MKTTLTFGTALVMLALVVPLQAEDKLNEYSQASWKELGLELVTPEKDKETGFVVGGVNDTKLLASVKSFNGRTIAELEKDMRPGAKSEVGSRKGFLGEQESLLEVLAADNKYVVDERKLDHQQLARHMLALAAIGQKEKDKEFRYEGKRYKVTLVLARGHQLSPFYDDTQTNVLATVRNVDGNFELSYSLLVPQMMERYGFYEGKGTPYRVPPEQILKLLDFVKIEGKP